MMSKIAKRTGAVAAVALTLTVAAAPHAAYARHGNGAAIAHGVLGGLALGTAIGSGQPAYTAPAPAYYYPQPQSYYYTPPAYYSAPTYSYYGDAPAYDPAPYGYANYGYDQE